jgi:hypothetical protein
MNSCSEQAHLQRIISPILKVTKFTERITVFSQSLETCSAALMGMLKRECMSLLRYLKIY